MVLISNFCRNWALKNKFIPLYIIVMPHTLLFRVMKYTKFYQRCMCCQYRREGDSQGKTPGPGPQEGPWKFCYCKIIFKKPFVGRSFVSSLRTSLSVRFVLILSAWFIVSSISSSGKGLFLPFQIWLKVLGTQILFYDSLVKKWLYRCFLSENNATFNT